jgi:hypothetical protein
MRQKKTKTAKTTEQQKKFKKPKKTMALPAADSQTKTPKRTIKTVVIETLAVNKEATNADMIAAVKAEFSASAFDEHHASWYRSQARKGLLTGIPISIPSQTKRLNPQSK